MLLDVLSSPRVVKAQLLTPVKHHVRTEFVYGLIEFQKCHIKGFAWAAQYSIWLLIDLTPKGIVFSFLLKALDYTGARETVRAWIA